MMLARTALRLAVMETLAPFAQERLPNPAWPTFAGRYVFDTQIGPNALADVDPTAPVIVVMTDETSVKADGDDVTVAWSGAPQTVTLAFEIMVPVAVQDGDRAELKAVGPTDAAAEALLDLIEEQIQQRLADGRMNGPLLHVLSQIGEVQSHPWRDGDAETQLSARRLELSCSVLRGELWPSTLPDDPQPFDYLPAPLAQVARALPAGSYGHKIATMLGSLIGRPADFLALNEMRLAINLKRDGSDTPPPPANAAPTPPEGDIGGSITL
jgi:hypothetical protein